MTLGIDTFGAHLDTLTEIRAAQDFAAGDPDGSFYVWNGNSRPLFAGRNFLANDFIWGHAEATNAESERNDGPKYPLAATAPSPDQQQNLQVLVNRIAPIQSSSDHQQIADYRGRLIGQIDATALCRRLVNAILSGEFSLGDLNVTFLDVWLCVDPTLPFSEEYWAGWADTVNNAILPVPLPGITLQHQPFRASIFCSYTAGADNKYRPEAHVAAVLATPHPGMNVTVHSMWADATVWDNAPADLVANGNPSMNWSQFDAATAPALWRIAKGFMVGGAAWAYNFNIDATGSAISSLNPCCKQNNGSPTCRRFNISDARQRLR